MISYLGLIVMLHSHTNDIKNNNSRYSKVKVPVGTDPVEKPPRLWKFSALFLVGFWEEKKNNLTTLELEK